MSYLHRGKRKIKHVLCTKTLEGVPPPIVVIGMHRSGTSLLSKILSSCGIQMGVSRSPNAESHFFQNINIGTLNPLGVSWASLSLLPRHDELLSLFDEWRTRSVKNSIEKEAALRHIGIKDSLKVIAGYAVDWGWKDPRNTILLPMWHKVFPNAKIIHIHRDGRECAASLLIRDIEKIKRKKVNIEKDDHLERLTSYFKVWEEYLKRAKKGIKKFEKVEEIKYSSILKREGKLEEIIEKYKSSEKKDVNIYKTVNKPERSKRVKEIYNWAKDRIGKRESLRKIGYE